MIVEPVGDALCESPQCTGCAETFLKATLVRSLFISLIWSSVLYAVFSFRQLGRRI